MNLFNHYVCVQWLLDVILTCRVLFHHADTGNQFCLSFHFMFSPTAVWRVIWRLNPQCRLIGKSHEWDLGLISGMGGWHPPLAFPSWIIMVLGVNPSCFLLRVDTSTLIRVPYLGLVGPAYSLSCSAHNHIIKCSWVRSMNSRTLLTHCKVPVSCYWVTVRISASTFTNMSGNLSR